MEAWWNFRRWCRVTRSFASSVGRSRKTGIPKGAQAIGSHEHSEEEVSDNQQRVVDAQSWTGFIWIYMILYSCLKSLSMRWYMVFRLKFGMSSATFVTRSSHHTSVVTQTTIGLNKHHTQEIRCVTVATSRVSVEGAGYSTNLSQGWPREPRNDRWLVKALIVGRSPVYRGVMRFGWTSMIVVTLW